MFKEINVNDLTVSDLNVRKSALTGIKELAANIKDLATKFKNDGLVHPLTVRKVGKKYQVVSGQRRLRAIEQINKEEKGFIEKVKCIVISGKKDKDVLLSLSENVYSQQMTALERYRAYSMLIDKGYTVNKIAQAFGTSVHSVNKALAIANLHQDVINAYENDMFGESVFHYLTTFSHKEQKRVVKEINEKAGWWHKNDIDQFFQRTKVDASWALFDVAKSGIACIEDIFEQNIYITDVEKFIDLQKEAVDTEIKRLEQHYDLPCLYFEPGKSINPFYNLTIRDYDFEDPDNNEGVEVPTHVLASLGENGYFEFRFAKLDDEEVEEIGVYLNPDKMSDFISFLEKKYKLPVIDVGSDSSWSYNEFRIEGDDISTATHLIVGGVIDGRGWMEFVNLDDNDLSEIETQLEEKDHESDVDDQIDGSGSEKVSKRQEITKAGQDYFKQWRHMMASMAIIDNGQNSLRMMLASMIVSRHVSFENYRYQWLEINDLDNSDLRKSVVEFLDQHNELLDKINSYNLSFDAVFEELLKEDDKTINELITAICVLSLSPESSLVDYLGRFYSIDSNDYWKPSDDFLEAVSSNPALIAIGDELIKNTNQFDAFKKMPIKGKKVKLNSLLNDDFKPKYLEFPVNKYTDVTMDIETLAF